LAEIAECVVGGDDFAARGRNLIDCTFDLGIELIELGEIGRGIGPVDFSPAGSAAISPSRILPT